MFPIFGLLTYSAFIDHADAVGVFFPKKFGRCSPLKYDARAFFVEGSKLGDNTDGHEGPFRIHPQGQCDPNQLQNLTEYEHLDQAKFPLPYIGPGNYPQPAGIGIYTLSDKDCTEISSTRVEHFNDIQIPVINLQHRYIVYPWQGFSLGD